jgi:ribosomal protein L11
VPARQVPLKALYEIAVVKKAVDENLDHLPIEAIARSALGTAKSMGLKVVRD